MKLSPVYTRINPGSECSRHPYFACCWISFTMLESLCTMWPGRWWQCLATSTLWVWWELKHRVVVAVRCVDGRDPCTMVRGKVRLSPTRHTMRCAHTMYNEMCTHDMQWGVYTRYTMRCVHTSSTVHTHSKEVGAHATQLEACCKRAHASELPQLRRHKAGCSGHMCTVQVNTSRAFPHHTCRDTDRQSRRYLVERLINFAFGRTNFAQLKILQHIHRKHDVPFGNIWHWKDSHTEVRRQKAFARYRPHKYRHQGPFVGGPFQEHPFRFRPTENLTGNK